MLENEINEQVEIELATIHGDLTNKMLEEIQVLKQPWEKTSEPEQAEIIDRIKSNAEHQIMRIANLLANKGFQHCAAAVDTVTHKEGCKIVLQANDEEGGLSFARRSGGGKVTVVFLDEKAYLNGGEMPEADSDQGDLLGAGEGERGDSDDVLMPELAAWIVHSEAVTINFIQRQFNIGYNRAARFIDTLLERGFVEKSDVEGVFTVLKLKDDETVNIETGEIEVDETPHNTK